MAPDAASRITAWQRRAGRHDLPWQQTRDPYRIWLSEIMLQQTQAATVIPYYERFLARFPTVMALADARIDAVLHLWSGLGYYARARNLHRCAQVLRDRHGGVFPASAARLAQLPGIGRSTAAAIAAFAWGERAPILDGNVRRVLARYAAIGGAPGAAATNRMLWAQAQAWLDAAPADLDMRAYTQGQMDLGATVCTRTQPDCTHCPLAPDCEARRQGRQQELPAARTRRVRPRQECWLLIAECQGRVLLHRRPDAGIWGGLWSLPEFGDQAALEHFCSPWPAPLTLPRELAAIDHAFTHFLLRIRPYQVCIPGPLPAVAGAGAARNADEDRAPGAAWVAIERLGARGMPAPVSKLLREQYPASTGHKISEAS